MTISSRGCHDDRPGQVVDAARQMFRLEALSQIARRKVASLFGADETEVYLAYVVALRDKLALTAVMPVMQYVFAVARVTVPDLDDALREVPERERSEFAQYLAVDYAPWRSLLQRKRGWPLRCRVDAHACAGREQRLEPDIDAEMREDRTGLRATRRRAATWGCG